MPKISVVTASPRALNWLEQFESARVLYLFPEVLNLIDGGNHILSIVSERIGNGPFSMVTRSNNFAHGLNVNSQISFSDQRLKIGQSIFCTEACKIWDPTPNWAALRRMNKNFLRNLLDGELSLSDMKDGFIEVFFGHNAGSHSKYFLTMKTQSSMLFEALSQKNSGGIINASGSLGGFGVGLTPSGDDFLVGVIIALWAVMPQEEAISTAELIWAGAAGQTTALSRAWLASAVHGEIGEVWHKLFNAAREQNEDRMILAASEILSTGETSGADALCGFVQALYILEKI